MENLKELTPNCYIVKNQYGYRKLLKKLNIHFRPNDKRDYSVDIYQLAENKMDVVDVKPDGSMRYKNYPIKYPALITFQDNTFEIGRYTLYITYDKLTN